jgi:phosphatidate cytidylyltransferase
VNADSAEFPRTATTGCVLKARLLTAAVALPALLAAIFLLPDSAFTVMIGVLGGWGLYEVYDAMRPLSAASTFALLILGIVPLLWLLAGPLAGLYPPPYLETQRALIILLAVLAIAMLNIITVGVSGPEAIPRGVVEVASGALYVGPLFPFFALVRNGTHGIELLVLMLLLVICADSGAYFVGRAIGRHKLAFKVSPGKTIEGAIGGIITAIAGGVILRAWLVPDWSIGSLIIFAGAVAILAIIGDLANSAFKRVAGVKESGWIFPGHGGLLDRTCSLVFAAVLTYYYSQ